jgi:hypothetical protein
VSFLYGFGILHTQMQIQKIPFEGWSNNIAISNDHVELIITLDVGPRIISYRTINGGGGGQNVFKNYSEQMGSSGESEWKIRGGHRLWLAPEGAMSYALDNSPVKYELTGNGIRIENDPVAPWGIRKILTISLAEDSPEVTLHHEAVSEGDQPVEIATWALSVMAPGGLEIIPNPTSGEHPRDLLPNRVIVPWPYTDLSDPRLRMGWKFITLRQTSGGAPTKLGLSHREKWVAYLNREALFVKTFDYIDGETYPDLGCNFETYTDANMLEIESLSPLRKLNPGESVGHTERWALLGGIPQPSSLKEEDLAKWIEPMIEPLLAKLHI